MSLDNIHEYIRHKQIHLLTSALEDSPQLLNKSDNDGRTPLMWALSESRDPETVSVVVKAARSCKGFDVDAADEAGFTALHIAASLGSEFVDLILSLNPTIDSKTNNLQTPLFLAVSKQQAEAARILIRHKASVKAKDKRQVTILQRAVSLGSLELVTLLLENGAPINATDAYGWTALHYAYAEARTDTIKLLLQHGADPNIKSREDELPYQVAPKGFEFEA